MFFNNMNNMNNVDNDEYYNLLNVSKNATSAEIKKSYKKLAMTNHPDKGGDEEKFKKITEAFQVIGNEKKRKLYDSGGKEALNSGGVPTDIFSMFNQQSKPKVNKGQNTEYNLNIKLEDIYTGMVKKLQVKRKVIDQKSIKNCKYCDGKGFIIKQVNLGIMNQQIQTPCTFCGGKKFSYEFKTLTEKLEVNVPKGVPDKKKILIYEKGDDIPNGIAGDIQININEMTHSSFTRKGSDLYYKKDISLVEALCGFEFDLTHLDGRKILVKSKPGEIIKPNIGDPLNNNNQKTWSCFNNTNIKSEPYARAEVVEIDKIKKTITEGQLKNQNITAFTINNNEVSFYKDSIDDINKNKYTQNKSILYTYSNNFNNEEKLKCLEDEGMPIYDNPILKGDLFILLNIKFPDKISEDLINYLLNSELSSTKCISKFKDDDSAEIHYITDKTPNLSPEENSGQDTSEEEQEEFNMGGAQQCTQQ